MIRPIFENAKELQKASEQMGSLLSDTGWEIFENQVKERINFLENEILNAYQSDGEPINEQEFLRQRIEREVLLSVLAFPHRVVEDATLVGEEINLDPYEKD